MASPSQNANALAFAQEIIDFTNQFASLLVKAQAIASQQAAHNYASNLQAMPTYAVNADGTTGAADGTPQQGNPITGLNQSFYNLDQARTALSVDFITFATGTGAASQLDRRTKIAAVQA